MTRDFIEPRVVRSQLWQKPALTLLQLASVERRSRVDT
jgi:hypothetical protein